jgi:hypothetical protein
MNIQWRGIKANAALKRNGELQGDINAERSLPGDLAKISRSTVSAAGAAARRSLKA